MEIHFKQSKAVLGLTPWPRKVVVYSSVDSAAPTYHLVFTGSNPTMHTVYAFIVKFCTVFVIVMRKGTKTNKKKPGLAHMFDKIKRYYNSKLRQH